jgi:hypothetical protein
MSRTSLIAMLSLLCCLEHSTHASTTLLRSGFHNRFFLNPFYSFALTVFVCVSKSFGSQNYETKFRHITVPFFIFSFSIILTLLSPLKSVVMLVSKAILCIDQSPVKLQQPQSGQQHYAPVELNSCFHFPGLEIIIL